MAGCSARVVHVGAGVQCGGVPGVGMRVGTGEGYTGYYPVPSSRTIFSLIPASGPYLRPNEGNIKVIDEVSEIRV